MVIPPLAASRYCRGVGHPRLPYIALAHVPDPPIALGRARTAQPPSRVTSKLPCSINPPPW